MKFQQIGRTAGDETTPYKVTDFKSRTVGEFIQEVLRENPKEWGYISVGGHFYQSRKKGCCEYRYGSLLSEIPKELLSVEIKEVLASGGWSRMDYTINWSEGNEQIGVKPQVVNDNGRRVAQWNNGVPELKKGEIKSLLVQYSKGFTKEHSLMCYYDIATVFENYMNQGKRCYTSDGNTKVLDWGKDVVRWMDMGDLI